MSIATEISRLQQAKADLKTAIEAKGVTVSSSDTIDDYAALVGQIQTGGGSSANLTTLNVTPTTSAQQITPTSPVDGYDEVNVAAVTSAIDANITAANIKKDVTILGVTGTNEGEFDFVYRIKRKEQSTISATEGAVLARLTPSNGNTNYVAQALYAMFSGCTNLVSADLSAITSLNAVSISQNMFANCNNLQTVDLSNLTIIGATAGASMFSGCSKLTAIRLNSLISAAYMGNMFANCTLLEEFYAPLLETYSNNAFTTTFNNCNSLRSVTIHPKVISSNSKNNNILGSITASAFTTLRLSALAVDNVYLSWSSYLDSDSILDVLNHLSTEATGKTCAFNNLTVASSDPNYAAISAKKAALTNWTITGLTILE